MSDVIMSQVIPNGAGGPVRDLTTFARVNAANGSIPAACALLFVGRKVLR
jgi:hypothetical protein